MKRLIIIFAILLLGIASPVYAYSPPGQGTDNATDIILWHGDNLTIESVNLTGAISINGLTDALLAAGEAQAEVLAESNETIFNSFLLFLIVVAVTGLVFWQKRIYLFLLAFPVLFVYGLGVASDNAIYSPGWVAGVAIAALGAYCLLVPALGSLLPSVFAWLRRKE